MIFDSLTLSPNLGNLFHDHFPRANLRNIHTYIHTLENKTKQTKVGGKGKGQRTLLTTLPQILDLRK